MNTPTLTRTAHHSMYAAPTVDRHTGAVWSQTADHREELCRLVVDTRYPDQPFYLHAKAALRLNTEKPMGRLHSRVCPTWRWATATDLDNWRN